jgi:flagellar biogenesis protein FliO
MYSGLFQTQNQHKSDHPQRLYKTLSSMTKRTILISGALLMVCMRFGRRISHLFIRHSLMQIVEYSIGDPCISQITLVIEGFLLRFVFADAPA